MKDKPDTYEQDWVDRKRALKRDRKRRVRERRERQKQKDMEHNTKLYRGKHND